jgi:hypothetical protein
MKEDVKVRRAEGGYIVTDRHGREYVFNNLEAVCRWLLLYWEGRGPTFAGDAYGDVVVIYRKPG